MRIPVPLEATTSTVPVSVTFSVRLSDGSYESSMSVPVGAPEAQWRPIVEAWLKLMEASLVPRAAEEMK